MLDETNKPSLDFNEKEFEKLTASYDPLYEDQKVAFDIVRKFIEDNKLILYGGMAIDYALRLRGDSIYPEDNVPDYDFYSPTNVEHAYQLADILYHKGYKDSRAINAMHMETMKNDIGDNHFITDITYRPQKVFDEIQYLTYNGLRIVHPDFQRIDQHSSLSFPFDGPPQEVIFARWEKDIKRFNKLNDHYPIVITGDIMPLRKITVPWVGRFVLTGFAAYAIIYSEFIAVNKDNKDESILKASFEVISEVTSEVSDFKNIVNITFDTLNQSCEFIHTDIDKAADEFMANQIVKSTKYEPFANMISQRIDLEYDDKTISILSSKHRVLSTNSVQIGNHKVRCANIQFIMKQFLSMYYVHRLTQPKIANTYRAYYKSLLDMATIGGCSIVLPSVQTYGGDNVSLSREVALNKLYNELEGVPAFKIPKNYYPDRSIPKQRPHPDFDPEEVEFFRESGRVQRSTIV